SSFSSSIVAVWRPDRFQSSPFVRASSRYWIGPSTWRPWVSALTPACRILHSVSFSGRALVVAQALRDDTSTPSTNSLVFTTQLLELTLALAHSLAVCGLGARALVEGFLQDAQGSGAALPRVHLLLLG